MSDLRSSLELIREELIADFSTISTLNSLDGIPFRTTVKNVNAIETTPDNIFDFPVLDILFGKRTLPAMDVNNTVFHSQVSVYLKGHFKPNGPSTTQFPMTESGEAFLHDVERVLIHYSLLSIASPVNRWMIDLKKNPAVINPWAEFDKLGNLQGIFWISCVLTVEYKGVTLLPEVHT